MVGHLTVAQLGEVRKCLTHRTFGWSLPARTARPWSAERMPLFGKGYWTEPGVGTVRS